MSNLFGFVSNDDFIAEMEKLIDVHGGLTKTLATYTGDIRFHYYAENGYKGYSATNFLKPIRFSHSTVEDTYLHTFDTLPEAEGIVEAINSKPQGSDTYVTTSDGTRLTEIGSVSFGGALYTYYAYGAYLGITDYSTEYLRLDGDTPLAGSVSLYSGIELDVDTEKKIYICGLDDVKKATIQGSATSDLKLSTTFDFGNGIKLVQSLGAEDVALIEKTVTANGVYSAEKDNADGYSKVTVDVAPPIGTPIGILSGTAKSITGIPKEVDE